MTQPAQPCGQSSLRLLLVQHLTDQFDEGWNLALRLDHDEDMAGTRMFAAMMLDSHAMGVGKTVQRGVQIASEPVAQRNDVDDIDSSVFEGNVFTEEFWRQKA